MIRSALLPAMTRCGVGLGAALVLLAAAGSARADCNADFGVLMNKRMAEIAALNKISKSHGGKLDPIEGCPRLRSLAAAEGALVSYIDKNKEWCGMPEDLSEKMTATKAKTETIATKACAFAVKMKQMMAEQQKQIETQQQQQAVKLPAGPL